MGRVNVNDSKVSGIQSVLISRKYFTLEQAYNWIYKHNFKHYKVDITDNFYRFRQYTPLPYKHFFTTKSKTNGIEYIIQF